MGRVALMGENSLEFISKLLDIWNNGDCAVLIDWRIPVERAIELMKESGVDKCCMDRLLYEKTKKCKSDIEFIVYDCLERKAKYLSEDIYSKFCSIYSNDEAIIVFSSGTTGKSKGIVLTHNSINTNADAICEYMRIAEKDCIYIVKSLTHASTIVGELLVALKKRIRLLISPIIVPVRYVFKNIVKYNVSIICINPILLSMYCKEYEKKEYKLKSLKTIYVSGSILNDKIYNIAHNIFCDIPIYNVYGLSEAGPRVSAQRADCCLNNSVGKPIDKVEIKIIDENGVEVPNGTEGIVHIKTKSAFKCYVTNNKKHSSLYKDWLNSGDIGYIDNDGELHIVNRIDDVIIINSHKVYPHNIIDQILKIEGVEDATVCKDVEGNKMVCFYEVREQSLCNESIIRSELSKQFPVYEIPDKFICVDSIHRNLNGKVENVSMIKKYITD